MATGNIATKPQAEEAQQRERTRCGQCYRPNCDILELPEELLVRADIPGAKADAIDVRFEDGTLSIHARVEPREEGRNYLLREYGVGDFYRSFEVSEAVDPSRIAAELHDGVLTLHLPKTPAVKPRKINVVS